MSAARPPYRERIAAAVHHEFDGAEQLLAATRLSLPTSSTRVDERGKERSGFDLSIVQQYVSITRTPPKPIPGFPVAWDMVVALTRQRLLVWSVRRGGEQPGGLLGAVKLSELTDAVVTSVPLRRGRGLVIKFVLRSGPRVMLDVVTGFREDTEHLASELSWLLAAGSRP